MELKSKGETMNFLKKYWIWIAGVLAVIAVIVLFFTFKGCSDKPNANLQSIENSLTAAKGTIDGVNLLNDNLQTLLGISRDSTRQLLELKLKVRTKTVYIEKPVIRTVTDTIIKGIAYQGFTEVSGSVAVSRSDADSTVDWIDRVAIKYDITGFELTFDETTINFNYDQKLPADMDWYLRGAGLIIGLILGIVL